MSVHYDIEIRCPHCGDTFLFHPKAGGEKYVESCDTCEGRFYVPANVENAPSAIVGEPVE